MAEGAVNEIVNALRAVSLQNINPNDSSKLNDNLKKLIESAKTNANCYENINLIDIFESIIGNNEFDGTVREQIYRTIAEITRISGQRKCFTNELIIKHLIERLASETEQSATETSSTTTTAASATTTLSDTQLLATIQLCRALGNICYNNDDARNIIVKLNGAVTIINLLDIKLDVNNELDVSVIKFRNGLLSNYLLGDNSLSVHAMKANILEKIENILDNYTAGPEQQQNDEILLNLIQPLSLITESVPDVHFSQKLIEHLAKILKISKDPDVAEICLEILNDQAENDEEVRLQLAKAGVCEAIYGLLETYKTLANTKEARALMKLACDLIVSILNGDEAMEYLYSGPLLKYMEDWLDSYDTDILTTAALALGNFARTDAHCIEMVERSTATKLLAILSKNNGLESEMKLQHALLSAFRNLVIPKQNKPIIIKAGLIETILPMLKSHHPHVVYKLIGTLRMLIDGQPQSALNLMENTTLIQELIRWGESTDYLSVTGEALRLIAWIIKHAYKDSMGTKVPQQPLKTTIAIQNRDHLKKFIQIDGCVRSMVTMLTTQHLVMQNEALIALCIMSSMFIQQNSDNDLNLTKLFIDCELGQKLAEFIQRSADEMTKEIVENVETLMSLLRTSNVLVKHLNDHDIDELLKTIPILKEYCTL